MFPARAARQLRELGIDAAAIDERSELRSAPDSEVLEAATREGRVVVTFNYRDFILLDRNSHAAGTVHGGIVIVSSRRFGQSNLQLTRIVDALAGFATERRDLRGMLLWLP